MAGTVTHLAIADKIYYKLGSDIIKNAPLFYGGNIAPDAIHAKKDYQRSDKKHSHLCDGIRSYGYGYPEIAKLFKDRIYEFIKNYYLTAGDDKDLYLGYIVHLLTDELYLLNTYDMLKKHLDSKGTIIDSKTLADLISNDPDEYNKEYIDFFSNLSKAYDISAQEYQFTQNVVDILESVWDYEVKDYIGANEINISKRWVIDKFLKDDITSNADIETAVKFIDFTADNIISQLSGEIL